MGGGDRVKGKADGRNESMRGGEGGRREEIDCAHCVAHAGISLYMRGTM